MKTLRYSLLCSVLAFLGLAALADASPGSGVAVKVSTSAGKVVTTGKTNSGGTFTTGKLSPGSYVVQFNGTLKDGSYALVINAGKESANAEVPAKKFTKGGVAMKIDVAEAGNLSVQVAPAGTIKAAPAQASSGSNAKGFKTKMVNGHEYIFIPPEQGDWNPGKWVDANSIEARNAEAQHRPTKTMPGGSGQ